MNDVYECNRCGGAEVLLLVIAKGCVSAGQGRGVQVFNMPQARVNLCD